VDEVEKGFVVVTDGAGRKFGNIFMFLVIGGKGKKEALAFKSLPELFLNEESFARNVKASHKIIN